ncbi:MAG: helix-turn-helix domain-containing protein [Cytophagaceae bacterium]|jgi:transcriptional regulator with XRE-family HTH domain|nr:helix-turn-helix domain-containing protein [Cytophagaceae bacterium]
MLFAKKIKQLREELQIPQRQLASALEIDTPMYSKIERGERPAKRKQIPFIANLLKTDEDILVTLWLADKIITAIGDEEEFAAQAWGIVQQAIKQG